MRKAQFGGSDLQRALAAWGHGDFPDVKGTATALQILGHDVDALQQKLSNLKFDEGLARVKFEEALKAAQGA
tara:strand:- start:240 stop:455 length:216 start_codon:yes stop_codon:yes gene_type:complete